MASLPIYNLVPNFLSGNSGDKGPSPEETKNNTNNANALENAENDTTQHTNTNSEGEAERSTGQKPLPNSKDVDLEKQKSRKLGHDDLDNIRVYNLRPTVYPPYVLDSVAQHKDLDEVDLSSPLGGTGGYGHIIGGARQSVDRLTNPTNDLFLSSINSNWGKLMTAVESKSSHLMQNKIVPLSPQQQQQLRLKSPQIPQQHLSSQISNPHFKGKQDTQYHNKPIDLSDTLNNYEATLKQYKLPDLSGSWEGGERLKKVINEDNSNTLSGSDGFANTSFFKIFQKPNNPRFDNFRRGGPHHGRLNDQKKLLDNKDYSPKIRSSANYWMSTEQRSQWKPTFKRVLLLNPYLLVTLRSFMLILSAVALGLAISIYRNSRGTGNNSISQQPSTIMAMVVQSIAMMYLIYITWDEYSGKPLGIRNPLDKIKLILLDLLFIMFSAANLSLAYNTLYDDRWVCVDTRLSKELTNSASSICEKQRGLSADLFITLCMWVFTFTISIFRVVERVSSPKAS